MPHDSRPPHPSPPDSSSDSAPGPDSAARSTPDTAAARGGVPLTVCWLAQGNEGYGLSRAILTLAAAVRDRGVAVHLLTLTHGEVVDKAHDQNIAVHNLGVGTAPRFGGHALQRFRSVRASRRHRRHALRSLLPILQQHRPDVLHCTSPAVLPLLATAARAVGARPVWEMPNVVGNSSRLPVGRAYFQTLAARHRVLVLANSRYTAASLGSWPRRARVFHLGVDTARFDPDRVTPVGRADLNIPEHADVFTVCARIDASKGQLPFWDALSQVRDPDRPAHLLALGGPTDGPVARAMRDLADQRHAGDRLHLLGNVDRPEAYYPLTDVAVNCRVDPEPFGLSVVEAMMMGRPVLVHALGGPAETVVDGRTGWHCPGPGVGHWAAALQRVRADRDRWAALGRQARDHALQHFTADHQARRYLGLLAEAGVTAAGDLGPAAS